MHKSIRLLPQLLGVLVVGTAVSSVPVLLRKPSGNVFIICYLGGIAGAGLAAYRLCRRAYPAPASRANRYGGSLLSAVTVAFLVFWAAGIILINTFGS